MHVSFARKQRWTVSCLARGAHFLFTQARTVLDAGAESSTAIRLSDDGTVEDTAGNDKCAAGTGVFLDTVSRMLRIPLAELGAESLRATNAEKITSTCAVFAESEVVSLVHRDPPVPLANILAGIHESMANRLFGLAQRVGMHSEVVMCGGVSRNRGIIRAMEAKLGKTVFADQHRAPGLSRGTRARGACQWPAAAAVSLACRVRKAIRSDCAPRLGDSHARRR